MADHAGVAGPARQVDRLQGFGERADLIHLDQDRVGHAQIEAALQAGAVGHEQVVAHQLHRAAQLVGEQLPAVPVVLGDAILDRDDREAIHQRRQLIHHLGAAVAAAVEGIAVVGKEFGAGHIQGQGNLVARAVAGLLDRLHQQVARFDVAQIRREPPLIAHGRAQALVLEQALEGVEHLGAHAQRLAEGRRAVGHQHEFLEIQAVGRVGTAVDHIHQRHRQQRGHRATQVAVEGQPNAVGGRPCRGQAHRQDRVGAEGRFVVGAVEFDHRRIHGGLIEGAQAAQGRGDLLLHVVHGLQHALAAVAAAAVAQFAGFMGTGAGAARHDRPAARTALEHHLGFNGGRAAGIEHFAGHDGVDDEVEGVDHGGLGTVLGA